MIAFDLELGSCVGSSSVQCGFSDDYLNSNAT